MPGMNWRRVQWEKAMRNPVRPELRGPISSPDGSRPRSRSRPAPPPPRRQGTFHCKSCRTERPIAEQSVAFPGRCAACLRGQPRTPRDHPSNREQARPEPERRPGGKAGKAGRPALPALYRWQEEALAAWRAHHDRGLVEAVTGTGKTRLGLEATRGELQAGGKVLVVVPSRELLNQWYAALRSSFRGYRIDRLGGGHRGSLDHADVLVAIVHTARKYGQLPAGRRGLLVADECHRYGAETFQRVLDPAFARRLGLTATYERSDGGHLTYLGPYFGGPPIFSLDYRRAIADDVAAHFKLALVGVALTAAERRRYLDADEALRGARAKLLHHGVPEEPYGEFMRAVTELAEGPRSPLRFAALRYLAAFGDRRQVLSESVGKLTLLAGLGPAVNAATGSLVFTMTTRGADRIATTLRQQGIPARALHSGLGSAERRELLRRFAERDLKALVAPMVLDEGVDVPEADLALVVAASRTRRQMIQRMGRVLRRKADGRLARIAIVYAAGSFEDPRLGAHEAFLDTVRDVADDQRDFRPGAPFEQIVDYLGPTPRLG